MSSIGMISKWVCTRVPQRTSRNFAFSFVSQTFSEHFDDYTRVQDTGNIPNGFANIIPLFGVIYEALVNEHNAGYTS